MADDAAPSHPSVPEAAASIAVIFNAVSGPDIDIDGDTNFFEAGVNSILVVRAVARIRATGLPISLRDVFAAPTANALARRILGERAVIGESLP
jgi:aryl carrier-like protein